MRRLTASRAWINLLIKHVSCNPSLGNSVQPHTHGLHLWHPAMLLALLYHGTKPSGKAFPVTAWWGFGSEVEEQGQVLCWWARHSHLALCLYTGTLISHAQVTSEAWGAVGETRCVVLRLPFGPEVLRLSRSSSVPPWHGDGPVESSGWQLLKRLLPRDPGNYYSIPLGFLQSIWRTKCTHLTQPLCFRINLLTCMELLLLFPTDRGGTELPKDLGEGHREGNHTWHS